MAVLLQRHRVVVDVVVVAFVVRQGEKECLARVMSGNWPIVERRPLRGIGCTTVLYTTAFQMEDEDARRAMSAEKRGWVMSLMTRFCIACPHWSTVTSTAESEGHCRSAAWEPGLLTRFHHPS